MRSLPRFVVLGFLLVSPLLLAQQPAKPSTRPPGAPGAAGGPGMRPPDGLPPGRPPMRCCAEKIFDATGKEFGEVIRWDDRFQSIQLQALARYRLSDGTTTAVVVAPEAVTGLVQLGGSAVLFTTADCSGNDAFVQAIAPPLMKRYGVVLPVGNGSTLMWNATEAWLFVTDPLPSRVSPGSTVFHSQWSESGSCSPYPAPGYIAGAGTMGYWVHRVEDLYKKFKRPFWTE